MHSSRKSNETLKKSQKKYQSRYIPIKIREKLLKKQGGKCANYGGKGILGGYYNCPLAYYTNGYFDKQLGFEIDHIVEHSKTFDNSEENLQLLCHSCHVYKTNNYITNNNKGHLRLGSNELQAGYQAMLDKDENKRTNKYLLNKYLGMYDSLMNNDIEMN